MQTRVVSSVLPAAGTSAGCFTEALTAPFKLPTCKPPEENPGATAALGNRACSSPATRLCSAEQRSRALSGAPRLTLGVLRGTGGLTDPKPYPAVSNGARTKPASAGSIPVPHPEVLPATGVSREAAKPRPRGDAASSQLGLSGFQKWPSSWVGCK